MIVFNIIYILGWVIHSEILYIFIYSTIDEKKRTSISFRLKCSDGANIALEDFDGYSLDYMNDAWRSLVSSDVIYKLATSKDVKKQHKAGKSLKVTGVIIKWLDYYSVIDDDMRFFSAYDSDGDGKLDYVTEGKMYFSDVANANLKKDGKNIGVGLIDIRPNTVKSVKNNVKLSELTELVL